MGGLMREGFCRLVLEALEQIPVLSAMIKEAVKLTVTDADLLLGYLDPDAFFGGEVALNIVLARRLLKEKIADHLHLDVVEAASGIYRIINSKMADALRVVSVEKGYDPREFALIVAGGAGPIHAGMIAKEMEIPVIIVPRESSVFCAAGMLFSNLKHDFVRTYTKGFDDLNIAEVGLRYEEMKSAARSTLKDEGISEERVHLTCSADIHYVGQFNEVAVPVSHEGNLEEAHLQEIAEDFHKKHDQLYGYALPGAPLELINLRLTAQGITDKPSFAEAPRLSSSVGAALKGYREAFFEDRFEKVPVYDGLKRGFGHSVGGPCIIEQPTTTIIVPKEYTVGCDRYNSYVMFHGALAPDEIKETFGRD